jgi:hypothetical protein
MDLQAYRDEIKLKLTGSILDLELSDSALDLVINSAFREIQRYICCTVLRTIPYSRCIDLSEYDINAVVRVYRTQGYLNSNNSISDTGYMVVDPMYATQWQLLSGTGNIANFSNYILDYASYNTLLQIRNTTSTDLAFRYDPFEKKLYINVSTNAPNEITIEYVPYYKDVSEIISPYWIDMLMRLAVALAKTTVGRIRSRYTQSNALWSQDGEALLSEGNAELTEIRQHLTANTQLVYPID